MTKKQLTKILVVEDEFVTSKYIAKNLQGLGYEVVGITSYGELALEKVDDLQPDLVLMDIKLKGMIDGVDTAKQIQRLYNVPVVYLTAHSDEQTVRRVMHSDAYGYIIKPFVEEELREAIEKALERHKAKKKMGPHR